MYHLDSKDFSEPHIHFIITSSLTTSRDIQNTLQVHVLM